jgi:hypothetical protein
MIVRNGVVLLAFAVLLTGQETRGTINGRVYDPQSAAISTARVVVTNVDTGAEMAVVTDASGYYEAPLLIPGAYRVTASHAGFKRMVRSGIGLQVGQTATVDLKLDVGAVADTITVTAEAAVLDSNPLESGSIISNAEIMELPVLGNNPTLLAKFQPGMQTDGVNNYLGLHSIAGGSAYNTAAGVGGNDWSIDGVPNNGGGRQAAMLPYSDSIVEFRIDTTGFDVSQGRGTGAQVVAMTKPGSNQYHGTLTEQHWQQRYNGTPYFTRQLYFRSIADAEARGDARLANELRNSERQPSGHSNNWAATIGGPVHIPKVYNGRNKLFFFFNYNGFNDAKTEEANQFNKTVPTMANRQGDFSNFLKIDPVRYQLYEPLSVRRDTSRSGTFWIRDPIPGNVIPQSRILMPKMYKFISDLYPAPNNDPTDPLQEPRNNYLAVATPWLWSYTAFQNRIDLNASNRHRFYGRWSWNNFLEDRQDWTYSTVRGMNTGGLQRKNIAATAGWTTTLTARTVLDFSAAVNEFTTGARKPVPLSYKAADLGLPSYIDDFAGDRHMIPRLTIAGYTDPTPSGYPTYTRYRVHSFVTNLNHLRGKHSLKAGWDVRLHFLTGSNGGNPTGYYRFDNRYTRRYSDTALYTAGDIGLSWAAFMLGLNYDSSIASTSASYASYSPYTGFYLQDQFRVTKKLTLYLGMRLEWEGGPTERYNRVIGYFDPAPKVFVSDVAESFYRANPTVNTTTVSGIEMPGLSPDAFKVRGGTSFPGVNGVPRNAWQNQWMPMPRVAFAWEVARGTVIRGGAGVFYDTLNVTSNTPNQTGFNRTTTFTTERDAGTIWRTGDPGSGISPMMDPFPAVGRDRFDIATSGALGLDTQAGRSYTYSDYDTRRAHQYRWRLGIQREIGKRSVVSLMYAGTYSTDVYITNDINPVPAEYWWRGNTRNTAIDSWLNGGVSNPFRLPNNFPGLQASNPALYADMNSQSFFTNTTVSRGQLLKPFPHMTGLSQSQTPEGRVRTHGIEATFQRRLARGWNLNFAYTGTKARAADWFPNSFDDKPAWEQSNSSRPHRLTATGIYQFPFGRRRAFFKSGALGKVLGGMQVAGTFETQSGPLLGWSNRYYYGDLSRIVKDDPTLDQWFNTEGTACNQTPGPETGWERCPQRAPNTYQTRIFPNRIPGLRRDRTLQTNANVQKEIPLNSERYKFLLRFDMLNVFNRYQFDNPSTDPMNTNFGRVQQQTAATNRFLQFQGRLQF